MSKYDHLFVTEARDAAPIYQGENGEAGGLPNVSEHLVLAGAADYPQSKIFTTSVIISESTERTVWTPVHKHKFDEIITWRGLDPESPRELGAELFMTIDGEEHVTTTSGSVYVPADTDHCPLGWNSVSRPFLISIIFLNGKYETDEFDRG